VRGLGAGLRWRSAPAFSTAWRRYSFVTEVLICAWGVVILASEAICRAGMSGGSFGGSRGMADAPIEPRLIGEAADFGTLQQILRDRAEELGCSRERLDDISGVQPGYSAKVLGPIPAKTLGRTSLGLILGGLALKLRVIEDPEQLKRIATRLIRKDPKAAHPRRPIQLSDLAPAIFERVMAEARRVLIEEILECWAMSERKPVKAAAGRCNGRKVNGRNGHRKAG
jgi:hypothetical protein